MDNPIQLLLEPDQLHSMLGQPDLLLIDMTADDHYRLAHLPGAVHLDFADIVSERPPTAGLLPDEKAFNRRMRALGLRQGMRVVVYDENNGLKACRLIWTLHCFGFDDASLLNGGLDAWQAAGLKLRSGRIQPIEGDIELRRTGAGVREAEAILDRLGRDDVVLLDARSAGEFKGVDVRAARGGRIPGAVHYEWSRAQDVCDHYRFRPPAALRDELGALGITPDKEVIVYCQTHRRSCVSWFTLRRLLGFEKVYGYPGAWSDWGNRTDLPIET
ncbi:MAG: sulfurtransferase [Pseudomonadota bacterium]